MTDPGASERKILAGNVTRDRILLGLLALSILTAGLGLRDPWPPDEPRFALVAGHMVESGDWLFPRVAGVLYPDKPPLYFWEMASLYALTGKLRVAFLLPSLVAALVTLGLVHDLGRRLWGDRAGRLAALALLITVQFPLHARTAQIDATLTMWVALGVYGLARHLLLGPSWGWYRVAFAAMGLGVITKGVGFLPVLMLLPWWFGRRRGWERLPEIPGSWRRWMVGPAVLLVTIGLWFVPMVVTVLRSGDPALRGYLGDILLRQTATRYVGSWHHVKPFWYYLVEVIPPFWFPLSLGLFWLVPRWRRALRARDARYLLLLGWVALVVLFFSLSPGKRGVYMLPALPVLAVAAGPLLPEILDRRGVRRSMRGCLWFLAGVPSLAWMYLGWIAPDAAIRLAESTDGVEALRFLLWLSALGVAAGLLALVLHPVRSYAAYIVGFWLLAGWWILPSINPLRTPEAQMLRASSMTGDGDLGLVGWREQHVLFAPRPVVHFGYRRNDPAEESRDALAWLIQDRSRRLLVSDTMPTDCLDTGRWTHLGARHGHHWYLLGPDAVRPGCAADLAARKPRIVVRYPDDSPPRR